MSKNGDNNGNSGGLVTRSASRIPKGRPSGANRLLGSVLVVESSPFISKLLQRSIEADGEFEVDIAPTFGEAQRAVLSAGKPFFAAVANLDLPDAPNGEIADFCIDRGLSTVVLTETLNAAVRERVLSKNIVDYFVKEERSIDAIARKLKRLHDNKSVKILVVDDSSTFRKITGNLLKVHNFNLVEAEDGKAALKVLDANPDTTLVITDYEMPKMNGNELVYGIRETRSRDELGIIGVSSFGSSSMSAMFLKAGADDFLTKPFEKEEFYCRVYRSIEAIENIRAIKRAAYTDNLTGLYNRLFFFKRAPSMFDLAAKGENALAVAMIDIDKFKAINDTFGHAGGDAALRHLASMLNEGFPRENLVARFGGEEFCVLAEGLDRKGASELFESLRSKVEASSVEHEGRSISFTLSIGVVLEVFGTLDETINQADQLLYKAKSSGRNRVLIGPGPEGPDAATVV